jgi:hypothetical protein
MPGGAELQDSDLQQAVEEVAFQAAAALSD